LPEFPYILIFVGSLGFLHQHFGSFLIGSEMFDVMLLGFNYEGSAKSKQGEGSPQKSVYKAQGIVDQKNLGCFSTIWSKV